MRIPWIESRGLAANEGRNVFMGRVACPDAGDADVERCIACPMLVGVDERDGVMRVYCRRAAVLPDTLFYHAL